MTPQELRSQLITILGSELGTYTSSVGKTYPAIWITPPMIDPSWEVSGLQVIIFADSEVQNKQPLTSDTLKREWWVIELVQHDVNKPLQVATDLIENFYPVSITRNKPQTRTDYAQARISIYDPKFTGKSRGYT